MSDKVKKFYNWLWNVYRYGPVTFDGLEPEEKRKLVNEFEEDCR